MFIKKNIKRLLNLIFFFDISLWLKCIKQIKKDKITKNSDFNWTMNIYDLYVLRKLIQ